jgi:DNA-directed RNA polymerase specialized sigma24 family protein
MAAERFPRLNNRQDLWQVLVMLTARKAFQERRRQRALKRGGQDNEDGVRSLSVAIDAPDLDEIIGTEPTPEFAVLVAEQCQALLQALPDDELRQIAQLRLEEHSNAEIAARFGWSERTVERKLALIRGAWEESAPTE